MNKPSPEVTKLAGKILATIGKRNPVEAMQALLICIEAIDFIANPKNDLNGEKRKT